MLGDFAIEEEIGRGGMGIVYRARQVSMGHRPVALKVLPSLIGVDEASVARFRREAEATGRLAHPGIVPVYAVGAEQGVHYFAMELIDGPSLESLLHAVADRTPERLLGSLFEESGFDQIFPRLTDSSSVSSLGGSSRYARSCARIVADLAAALAVAHRGGVIHRDLKPSNVLLRPSGQPVLVDFGLARDERMLGLTQSGDAIGTPSYMAPEQACGDRRCDGRTDVYGLGATLYEMLALRPPFSGAHPGEIMRRIVEDLPTPLREINSRVPEDLARIVSCCLEKVPEARYASIEAVELDLRNFLAGRPVLARSPSRIRRLTQSLLRHRRTVVVGAGVLCATTLAFVGVGLSARNADQEAGRGALEDALADLRDGPPFSVAEEAYGRARALLGERAVLDARRRHLSESFDELDRSGWHAELLRYLDLDWSREVRDVRELREEPWWRELHARAEGRGAILIPGLRDDARVALRRIGPDGKLAEVPIPWVEHEVLPLGEWFVEVDAPGCAPVAHRVAIRRGEQRIELRPLLVADDLIHPAEVVVPMPGTSGGIAIRRDEVAAIEFDRVLADVPDLALRREMLPERGGAAPRPVAGEPVLGVSWRAGRAFAIAVGAHVPSYGEYLAAATAGFERWAYPFGPVFEWERVAASPDGVLDAPLPAGAVGADAASPHGVRHLVGNAAELIAPEANGVVASAVGGSFRDDDPSRLRVDSMDRLGPATASRVVGLRVARFLPPPDDHGRRDRTAERLTIARREASRALIQEWTVRRDGVVEWDLSLVGQARETGTSTRLSLATPGFRIGRPTVRDAHGRDLPARQLRDVGDYQELEVGVALRRGAAYRLRIEAELEPRGGLFAHGAHHELRLPLKAATGAHSLHLVRLPPGSHVDRVEPEPQWSFHQDGGPVLFWELDVESSLRQATVLFRIDGSLATPWPSHGEGARALIRLLDALATSDTASRGAGLALQLQPGFVLAPQGLDRDQLVAGAGAGERLELLDLDQIDDVTGVGGSVSVLARVAWSGPGDRVIREWPIHAIFERSADELRAVALGPRILVDGGVLAEGRYRHDQLGLSIVLPPGVVAQRDAAGPWELQLHLRESAGSEPAQVTAWVDIRGFRASRQPEVGATEALDRLTAGMSFASTAGVIDLARGVWDSPRADLRTRRFDQVVFPPIARGGPTRVERWDLVQRGYRWFLVRSVAVGDTTTDAERGLHRCQATLLAPVLTALEVSGAAGRADGVESGRR